MVRKRRRRQRRRIAGRKLLAETIVFQVQTYRGDWINMKVVERAADEEWNLEAARNWRPKVRFSILPVEEEDLETFINEETIDKSMVK